MIHSARAKVVKEHVEDGSECQRGGFAGIRLFHDHLANMDLTKNSKMPI